MASANAHDAIKNPFQLGFKKIIKEHRFIKRLTKPGMGFASFNTASQTLRGMEAMNMIRTRTGSRG